MLIKLLQNRNDNFVSNLVVVFASAVSMSDSNEYGKSSTLLTIFSFKYLIVENSLTDTKKKSTVD